jgi:hypothetical protein
MSNYKHREKFIAFPARFTKSQREKIVKLSANFGGNESEALRNIVEQYEA